MTVPTEPLPPLVTTSDPDYAKYKAGDEDWLLQVASDAIRDYCGWHICPSITETVRQLEIGSSGIVILPSRYVTDVTEVRYHDHADTAQPIVAVVVELPPEPHTAAAVAVAANVLAEAGVLAVDEGIIDPTTYEWFQDGWIENIKSPTSGWVGYGPNDPYYQPTPKNLLVDVTMTHGYETLPANLKQIAFEMAAGAASSAGLISGVKTIQSPQYSATFTDAVKAGMTMSPDHLNTLNDYRLGGWFA